MLEKLKQLKIDYYISIGIVVFIIIFDQITKIITEVSFENVGDSISVIGDFFRLSYHINTGAAWSSFDGQTLILILAPIIGISLFTYFLVKECDFKNLLFHSLGLSLMIGGAFGNLIDRAFKQGVTDFLDFVIFGYDFPTFNIADISLVIGCILFGVHIIFFDNKKDENSRNSSN